jgi:hypothetical protein
MATGQKTGGRRRGTPNRRTAEVRELLENLDCDPIEGMVLLAQDTRNSAELRGRMFSELACYAHAKRKAIEVTGEGVGWQPKDITVRFVGPSTAGEKHEADGG